MRYSVLTRLLATVVAACLAVPSWAANFQIDVMPAAAFDPITFAPIPLQFDSNGGLLGGRQMVIQVDVSVFSSGYSAANDERGFGNMSFSLDLFGAFHNTSQPGWQAENSLVSPFDANSAGRAPQWFLNADAGVANDLRNILIANPVVASPTASDPRPWQTMGAALKVGSVFLDWDGIGSGGVTVTPGQASFARASNGYMELFQPGQATMAGNFLGSPGWQPPPPAVPAVAPPSQTPLTISPPPTAPPPPVLPPAASPPQLELQPPAVDPVAAPIVSPRPIHVPPQDPIVPPAQVEPMPPIAPPPVATPHVEPIVTPPIGSLPIETGPPPVDPVINPPINSPPNDDGQSIGLDPTNIQPGVVVPIDLSDSGMMIFPWPQFRIDTLTWIRELDVDAAHELLVEFPDGPFQMAHLSGGQSMLLAYRASDFFNVYVASVSGNVDGVPEPSSFILAVLAAITSGVASHRRWRANRVA